MLKKGTEKGDPSLKGGGRQGRRGSLVIKKEPREK